jgi:hypothetical protein
MSVGTSSGAISGFAMKGEHFAKQWRIPLEYHKQQRIYNCNGIQKQMYYRVIPVRYTIPPGWYGGAYGKDVRHLDGPTRYAKSNKAYRTKVTPGTNQGISKGRSLKWKGAASAFALSLGGSLQYDGGHQQTITAGNKTSYHHEIWGQYDVVSGRPGIFYSY